MNVIYHGAQTEAVFEFANCDDRNAVVRLRVAGNAEAEQIGPAVLALLNDVQAKFRCRELRDALEEYLRNDLTAEMTAKAVNRAAKVINAIELVRMETRQPVA